MNNAYLSVGVLVFAAAAATAFVVGGRGVVQMQVGWMQYATTTFSISYPPGYVPEVFDAEDIAPGKRASGVKFIIDPALTAGNNLSADSYLSVEYLPTLVACDATPYLHHPTTLPRLTDDGHVYAVAKEEGAVAGGSYEETVYVRTDAERCLAVRYVIHTDNLGKYRPGTVSAFDRSRLVEVFDLMRRSLILR